MTDERHSDKDREVKPWEKHPVRTLHACVETLATALNGYLPWEELRDANVRRLEMLVKDTVERADACMTIIGHANRVRPELQQRTGDWWCPQCKDALPWNRVTNSERCDTCGTPVHVAGEGEVARLERDLAAANRSLDWCGKQIDGCGKYTKGGETIAQALERNWIDSQNALGLFAKERIRSEKAEAELSAALSTTGHTGGIVPIRNHVGPWCSSARALIRAARRNELSTEQIDGLEMEVQAAELPGQIAWHVVNKAGAFARNGFSYERSEDLVTCADADWPANAPHRAVPLYTDTEIVSATGAPTSTTSDRTITRCVGDQLDQTKP